MKLRDQAQIIDRRVELTNRARQAKEEMDRQQRIYRIIETKKGQAEQMREREKKEYDYFWKNIDQEKEIIKEDKKVKLRMDNEQKAKKLFKKSIINDL